MKGIRLATGIGLLIGFAACEVQVRSGSPPPANAPPTSRQGTAPAAAPMPRVPPPAPTTAPTTRATPTSPAPSPISAVAARQVNQLAIVRSPAGVQQMSRARSVRPPASRNIASISGNVGVLIRQRPPTECGLQQPMPDTRPNYFVHIDCNRYSPVVGAKPANTARMAKLFRQGKLRVSPPASAIRSVPHGRSQVTAAAGEQELPAEVDHRLEGTEGPVKDQEQVGACTAFSLSSALDNAIRRLNKPDTSSSMHIWMRYGYPNMGQAADANLNRPVAKWDEWPYNATDACKAYKGSSTYGCGDVYKVQQDTASKDPRLVAKLRTTDAAGVYKITSIDRIRTSPLDPKDLMVVLATGRDIWVAMSTGGAWSKVKDGVIPEYSTAGGGHAVIFAGYKTTANGRMFLIHNSWTEGWGDKGYAWISEKMVRQHLYDAYSIKVEDGAAPPPPPPPPPPPTKDTCAAGFGRAAPGAICTKICKAQSECSAGTSCTQANGQSNSVCVADNPLTDDNCADDELVDSITGLCVVMCSNDERPAGGLCD